MTCQGGDVSGGCDHFSLYPLGFSTAEEHVASFRMCLEMILTGVFSLMGCLDTWVPIALGSLVREVRSPLPGGSLPNFLLHQSSLSRRYPSCSRLTLHSMQCPSSDPHIASPQALGGLVQVLSPVEGTERGLDQLSVRDRAKKDVRSGLGLDDFGVRVGIWLRVGVRVRVRFMVRFGSGSQ